MDFGFTQEESDLRREIEEFVKEALPPDWDEWAVYWPGSYGTMPQMEAEFQEVTKSFNRMLGEKGWLSLGWPREYGGQGSTMKAAIAGDVFSYYRVPSGGVATTICAPSLILVGSEKLKKEFLPRIASGEIGFWLAYSEPNAGSDLVSLKTSAVDDGDAFIVNGQKIWSSGAHVTEYGWAIVKTDPNAPGHKSATLMIIPNDTPGVTINPIINICGNHSFNEVFYDDVRVPKEYVVGEVNKGFYNVMLALQFERMSIGSGGFRRVLEELVQFAKETVRNGRPLSEDPRVRRALAAIAVEIEVFLTFYWQSAWMQDRGQVPELEASALKLIFTELSVKLANTAVDLLGPYGLLDKGSKWAPFGGRVGVGYLDSISGPIGAGTSEIQKTILATRGLGLPRER
ncbi:acyl-CoA dehydrogenase family protein [bacterium]|nr:acyl-CoA dehydrogenase family protein [bacterium]